MLFRSSPDPEAEKLLKDKAWFRQALLHFHCRILHNWEREGECVVQIQKIPSVLKGETEQAVFVVSVDRLRFCVCLTRGDCKADRKLFLEQGR